jgi:hypothetical protein
MGVVQYIAIKIDEEPVRLLQVGKRHIEEMHGKHPTLRGRPLYIDITESILCVFPAPDRDYKLQVLYYPPLEEL